MDKSMVEESRLFQKAMKVFAIVFLPFLVISTIPTDLTINSSPPEERVRYEVYDEAKLLQVAPFKRRIEEIKFHEPTERVVVLTAPGEVENLNDYVLQFARKKGKNLGLISEEDPNYWSDGLFILAVAPDSRIVGTYFGEDVTVPQSKQDLIQESTKDLFRDADWAGGLVAGVSKASTLIGDTQGFLLRDLVLGGFGVGLIGYLIRRLQKNKKTIAENTQLFQQNLPRTEDLILKTKEEIEKVPSENPYHEEIDDKLRDIDRALTPLIEENYGLEKMGFPGEFLRRNSDKSDTLIKELDDLIFDLKAVSNLIIIILQKAEWENLWSEEVRITRENLDDLSSLINSVKISDPFIDPERLVETNREKEKLSSMVDQVNQRLFKREMTSTDAYRALGKINHDVYKTSKNLILRSVGREFESVRWSNRDRYRYSGGWYSNYYVGSYASNYSYYQRRINKSSNTYVAPESSSGSSGYSSGSGFSGSGSSSRF